ncbi:hypothetical protein HYV80_02195 [Candidatus Woesearchaeota archaeon]|nr:hypothetical protein [Candidatus Woesearchaeota archaeon]
MKSLKAFYLEKKKSLLNAVYIPPKYKHKESQEKLNKYVGYFPRLKRLKEAEYFREEFTEPEIEEARIQA